MLNKNSSYLQIAFNRSLQEVERMINLLPRSNRILVEAGTSFVKHYGQQGIAEIKRTWNARLGEEGYIVADLKIADRGAREVELAAQAGASAVTCLGRAHPRTIDDFIERCEELNIDSMVDMLNIRFPFQVLQNLRKMPKIIVLHRGVEEGQKSKREIPYEQIHQILGTYDNVLISVAGGESLHDLQEAIFNDANIAVMWRAFAENPSKTAILASRFLEELK